LDYARPQGLDEAVRSLKGGARALAGGTDLLVRLGREEDWPPGLVDLKSIPELRVLEVNKKGLRLGAGLSFAELLASHEIAAYPALHEACRVFAARQIRSRATLGGNLANASPAADVLPPLVAHGASCRSDRRLIPAEELCRGPGVTVLAPDELLVCVELPRPVPGCRSFFHKLASRDAMAIAVVSVAAYLEMDGELAKSARIALGAVAPTVIRAREAEAALAGGPLSSERIARAADAAMAESSPIDDIRGSARYRRLMVGRLLEYHLARLAGPKAASS